MNFLRKNKLKIKIENVENAVKFNIEYFKLKESEIFKKRLLESIIGSGLSLAIINTKFMYRQQNKNYSNDLNELIGQLDKLDIKYKKVVVKRTQNVSVFGIPVKQNSEKKYEDYVIGFVIKAEDLDSIMFRLNSYNLQYYIDCNKSSADELLDRFESSYDDEEALKLKFKYSIFEDNFIKQVAVCSRDEDSEFISEILENLNKEL